MSGTANDGFVQMYLNKFPLNCQRHLANLLDLLGALTSVYERISMPRSPAERHTIGRDESTAPALSRARVFRRDSVAVHLSIKGHS